MNVNEILISMDSNWFIDRNKRQAIGYSGENAVVEFKLEATPEEGFTYYLDVQSKKIKNIILLDDELSVTLTTEMLGEAGIKKMQIVAYNETQVKKSNIFEVEVGESINATEEVEGHFASALNQISEWIAGVYRALTGKQNKLVPGANIAIDETDPEHPVISATGGGSGGDYTGNYPIEIDANGIISCPEFNKLIDDTIDVIIGKNIAPPNLTDGYLKPDGSLTIYSDWATTDFIKVEDLENVIYSAYNANDEQQYATTMFFLTVYDSSKNVIEQVSSPSYTYEVGTNVSYIRFSIHTDIIDHFMVESGTIYSNYEPYTKTYKAVNSEYALESEVDSINKNLLAIDKCFDSDYVFYDADFSLSPSAISNNGVLINTLPDTKTTDYIDCSEWFGIRYTGASWLVCRALAFYDSSKNWIISYPETGDTTYYTNEIIPIPKNAKYVVFGDLTKKVAQTLQIEINIGKKTNGKWKGKKWTCVGDSLTEYNLRTNLHYFDYVAQATEISVVNMGKSGTGYKNTYDEGFAFYQRIVNVPLDSDVITIFGSFNDLGKGYTLGTETDTGTETIAGCINTTLDNLFERLPLANVGIVSPTPWVGYFPLDTHIGAQYSSLLEKICKRRGIPFLNLYSNSALRPWEAEFRELCYSKDEGNGVHPDETGHKIIAPRFKAFLETLLI